MACSVVPIGADSSRSHSTSGVGLGDSMGSSVGGAAVAASVALTEASGIGVTVAEATGVSVSVGLEGEAVAIAGSSAGAGTCVTAGGVPENEAALGDGSAHGSNAGVALRDGESEGFGDGDDGVTVTGGDSGAANVLNRKSVPLPGKPGAACPPV